MNILFSMRHAGALRNYASTVEELARRGHRIHLTFMTSDKLRDPRLLLELTRAYPGVTTVELPQKAPQRPWLAFARAHRSVGDYLRYRTPEYSDAQALHDRAARHVPPAVRRFVGLPLVRTHGGLALLMRLRDVLERAIPPDPWVAGIVASLAPDVVLVTPLVDLASDQVEYVKAARALGVPCGLCVHSWDNLTNKGLIHARPDRVFVWNEAQRREAVGLHGIPAADVVVTGAPVYDQWFARGPSTTRDEFCRKVGLPSARPYVLYVCSSQFIAPREADFVRRWIEAVRSAADHRVRQAGILVRPHPRSDMRRWQGVDLTAFRDVVLWPAEATNPVDAASKNDYFDSLYHAAAAVGINTSAQIEAGIVGRQVYSVRTPEYAATQEGTLHFHYLLNEHGGLLHMASTLDEHTLALAGAFDRTPDDDRRLRTFVEGFVRPHGLDRAATPMLADAIERLSQVRMSVPERIPVWVRVIRRALYTVAARMRAEDKRAVSRGVPPERLEKKREWVH
jgi:hypothetical protein